MVHDILAFGEFIAEPELSRVVLFLFSNANAQSTRNTYKVGQKRFREFVQKHPGLTELPFLPTTLSLKGISLCFFIASLFVYTPLKSAATIRGYVSHVRGAWTNNGGILSDFDSETVNKILRGVRRIRPQPPDVRAAFLLPHLDFPHYFFDPLNTSQLLLKAAVILGFFGMYRFNTYDRLTLSCGRCRPEGQRTSTL